MHGSPFEYCDSFSVSAFPHLPEKCGTRAHDLNPEGESGEKWRGHNQEWHGDRIVEHALHDAISGDQQVFLYFEPEDAAEIARRGPQTLNAKQVGHYDDVRKG